MAERNEKEIGRGRKGQGSSTSVERRVGLELVNSLMVVNVLASSKYDTVESLGSPTHAQ